MEASINIEDDTQRQFNIEEFPRSNSVDNEQPPPITIEEIQEEVTEPEKKRKKRLRTRVNRQTSDDSDEENLNKRKRRRKNRKEVMFVADRHHITLPDNNELVVGELEGQFDDIPPLEYGLNSVHNNN